MIIKNHGAKLLFAAIFVAFFLVALFTSLPAGRVSAFSFTLNLFLLSHILPAFLLHLFNHKYNYSNPPGLLLYQSLRHGLSPGIRSPKNHLYINSNLFFYCCCHFSFHPSLNQVRNRRQGLCIFWTAQCKKT